MYDLGAKPMLLHGNGLQRSTHNGTQTVNHNLEHEILFHEQTSHFFKDDRNLRRPQGKRTYLPTTGSSNQTVLEKAISSKQDLIRNLREQFDSAPEVD